MFRIGALVIAASLAAPALAGDAPPAPRVARYTLAEFRKVVSAGGERASAVRGTVTVSGGTARWDLVTGTFPRSTANSFLVGERNAWLVDRTVSVAARARMEDLRALFVPPEEGDPGPFQASVRDLQVTAADPVRGPSFRGRPTARYRIQAGWSLVTSMPGRVGRIRTTLSLTFDALDPAPEEARSPLDDVSRLLDVPEAVREALAPHLGAIRGWPVGVVVVTDAELSAEPAGVAGGTVEERRPVTVRTESRREVADLVVGKAAPADLAGLTIGEETRLVGIERLVEPRETLR
jgi:hypothetical protein